VAYTDTDRRLLQQCVSRTPGGWEHFVDRFIGIFVHVIQHTAHARSVPLNSDDVDDLCADIFVTLLKDDFKVLRRFRGESALSTYLTVVARRIVVHQIVARRKSEAMGHVHAHQASLDSAGNHSQSESVVDDHDEVRSLLEGLGAPDRDVVRLFHLEGQTYQEISKQLGISENSIGPILSRAREQMRKLKAKSPSATDRKETLAAH